MALLLLGMEEMGSDRQVKRLPAGVAEPLR
jgi:hypothetical protein